MFRANYQRFISIFQTLWPDKCLFCQLSSQTGYSLCAICEKQLPWLTHFNRQPAMPSELTGRINHLSAQAFTLFTYEPPINHLILAMKFSHQTHYAHLFGQLLALQLERYWPSTSLPQAIIPVPLHWRRLMGRGYNQAIAISQPIARHLGIPLDRTSVIRRKPTQAQAELQGNARQHNVSKAFQIKTTLSYQHVAIVDDVITTGHTLKELAKTLSRAGVNRIDYWCVAKAGNVHEITSAFSAPD